MSPRLIEENELVEHVFLPWRLPLRERYDAYKGHVYRVLNFTCALLQDREDDLAEYGAPGDLETRIAIAACFHDVDFVFEGNVDYLEPSRERALEWLAENGRSAWADEVGLMIVWHHKLTSYRAEHAALVEPFRKADLIDLSLGTIDFGLSRDYYHTVRRRFPNAGFHGILFRTLGGNLLRHPFNPFPMMRR